MGSVAVGAQPSVVTRVVNLPLVSSTYDLVSSVYINTKDQYPYLKSVCDIAEKGVRTITSVAVTSALPIIQKLEPQIAVANTYACKGLDRIEEKLPILNQPTNQVVANAKGAMTGARDAVTTTVTGAKDSVASTITGVVDKTKGAVTGSVEKTKSVVNGSINTVLESRMMQLVSSGVENALTKSELLVDQYLPLTEEELEKEAKKVEGFDVVQKPSYYVRLGSLSTKFRSRAYQQALGRVKEAKQKSQETLSQLQSTVNLIEFARKNVHNANQKIQNAQDKFYLSWVEWKRSIGHDDIDESHCAEHIESRTLTIARNLTQQLQTTCHTLLSNLQGLPQNIQDQANHLAVMAGDISSVFHNVASFKEVSNGLLTSSKGQLQKMKESLDDVMDYLVNNTPLNWLILDFTTIDLTSETDEIPDIIALEEEDGPDHSHSNGPVPSEQNAE
ncbi:perilipin-2 [Dasypus novemcinctus]|uniref:perilipin-2 n=1 Tax=Dasypus novemcinctus TaxID=9361 RepID=UPI00265DEC15|nr:perilipin-2 [Dasypus novemcinctus]XP_058157894.1 perilipin-2 [Dasypus novemcinctus]XP_058157895.1 perilipin-2 [Dasypus novemcinctus]XP_058157896.1 perilipin-2 [Dasypus novemcinctus]